MEYRADGGNAVRGKTVCSGFRCTRGGQAARRGSSSYWSPDSRLLKKFFQVPKFSGCSRCCPDLRF